MQELILAPIYRWGNKSIPGSKGKQGEVGNWDSGRLALGPTLPSCCTVRTDVIFLELIFIPIPHFIYISNYQDIKTEGKKRSFSGFL